MKTFKLVVVSCLLSFCVSGLIWSQGNIPHLKKQANGITQLIVEGKPFLMLSGELGNSTATDLSALDGIFSNLRSRNLNTVLVPITWEHIEPQEGKFEFEKLDGLIAAARRNNIKLVILWFGSWKNTYSSYIPEWVKRDSRRFPRVIMRNGEPTERLTPLNENNMKADSKAYAAVMKHIKEIDVTRTVLMMQVQNEVGVIPEPRDFSPQANAAFNGPVPEKLMSYMVQNADILEPEVFGAWVAAGKKTSGTWPEVFGKIPLTDCLFMAWYYAVYIGDQCKAGKAEYNIPMFTNAALIRPNYLPGQYNSGGPLPHSMDIYRVGGPDIDFISPDIYFANYAYWGGRYSSPRKGNPLFVPETAAGATGAANALYSFGQLDAIGFSPFGIERRGAPAGAAGPGAQGFGGGGTDPLVNAYAVIDYLSDEILARQGNRELMASIVLEGRDQRYGRIEFGGYNIRVEWSGSAETNNRVGILFLKMAEDEFLITGSGASQLRFLPGTVSDRAVIGIASIDEQVLDNGNWVWKRRLNGDQSGQGQVLNISTPSVIYKVRLYRY